MRSAWISDDITFCSSNCGWKKKCFRNSANIKNPLIPHSFAKFKGTDECPKEAMKKNRKRQVQE